MKNIKHKKEVGLLMRDYLSSSAEARQANVDPEQGYYEFFRPLIQRGLDASNSQNHRIVQGGGGKVTLILELNVDFLMATLGGVHVSWSQRGMIGI